MTGQFEYSENSQDSEYLSSLGDVLQGVGGGDQVEAHRDEEGEDAEEVDNVEERGEKFKLVGSNN